MHSSMYTICSMSFVAPECQVRNWGAIRSWVIFRFVTIVIVIVVVVVVAAVVVVAVTVVQLRSIAREGIFAEYSCRHSCFVFDKWHVH